MIKFSIRNGVWSALVLVWLCAAAQVQAANSDYVSAVTNTPNLIGYWRFDPVFKTNSLVNGYTGTLHGNAQIGAPGTGYLMGSDLANQALLLDGTNSYVATSLNGQIMNQGSVLVWVYLTNQPSAAGHFFQITSQAQSGNDFDLQIQTDNYLYFFTDSGSATVYQQALPLNQWHFLAATFVTNATRAIYLDGRLVASANAGGHSVNNTALWIGNNSVFGPRMFQGRLDEVAIYNRALSASEISNIYSAALSPMLNLTALTNGMLLTWPTNFPGFTIQTNSSLTFGNWGVLTTNTNYGTIFTNFAFTNTSGGPQLFYRLKK